MRDLAAVPDGARVLCADGTIRATYSYGRAWIDIAVVDRATALDAVPGSSQLYAVRGGGEGCAGIRVVRVGEPSEPLGCVETQSGPSAVAFSLTPRGGWLAAGDTVWRSGDRLTWRETASAS